MELRQLKYFLAVAEHLNFSRAAEALYISQPALSYQIAELEKELGAELFVRDRRKVYLTAAGGSLLEPARSVLNASQGILNLASHGFPADNELGNLCIGFDSTEDHFECTGVTETIARFSNRYPGVGMQYRQRSFSDCVDALVFGQLDMAVLVLHYSLGLPPELASIPVHSDRLTLVCEKDDTLKSCEDIIGKYPLILVQERPRGQSRVMRCMEDLGLDPRTYVVDSIPASFIFAQAGNGAMILPRNYFKQHKYHGLMAVDIPGDGAKISHVLAWNKNQNNHMVQHLVNEFVEA